ncbi:MAG TPA: hypothetical protein VHT70_05700 [Candidatus Saccharimonadales bacterium]|jgi:hypothetical protein|nr:hypothetical protein [Candidatus Saccharimonadales bacterium]
MSKEFLSEQNQPAQFVELPGAWGLGPGQVLPSHYYDHPRYAEITVEGLADYYDTPGTQNVSAGLYLRTVLPGVEAESLSTEGSSNIVFGDNTTAYKIRREQPLQYSDVEAEAAAVAKLYEIGVGPELKALIDASPKYRRDAWDHAPDPLDDQPIVRVDGPGAFPILAMGRHDLMSLDELPMEQIISDYIQIAGTMETHNILPVDIEVYADRDTGHAIIIDAGVVSQLPADEPHKAELIADELLHYFEPLNAYLPDTEDTALALEHGGAEGIRALLVERLQQQRGED